LSKGLSLGQAELADACLDLGDAAPGDAQFIHTEADQHRHRQRIRRQLAAHADPFAMGMGRAHSDVDQLQHRRVQAVSLGGQGRMTTVDRQRVLGQVVGADAKEIHLFGQHRRQQGGGRHFDHDPQLQVGNRDFQTQAFGHVAGLTPLFDAADHREHDPQRTVVRRTQQGAQLRFHDLRTLQGQANPAHAEERVFFLGDRPIRQRFVAADIEGAHHQRPSG